MWFPYQHGLCCFAGAIREYNNCDSRPGRYESLTDLSECMVILLIYRDDMVILVIYGIHDNEDTFHYIFVFRNYNSIRTYLLSRPAQFNLKTVLLHPTILLNKILKKIVLKHRLLSKSKYPLYKYFYVVNIYL